MESDAGTTAYMQLFSTSYGGLHRKLGIFNVLMRSEE